VPSPSIRSGIDSADTLSIDRAPVTGGAPSALVELVGVTKTFGTKAALADVTWSVPTGQICGLLGPNGAGKTTLFRLLMGILKTTAGRLCIDGRDAFDDRVALKRIVGFLPDEPVFYTYLSGRETLELSAGMHGLDARAAVRRLQPLVERLGMTEPLDRYADDYSRGMKKKLGLLLAVLHEPRLLVLDEPTNGLDVESTRLFFDLMRDVAIAGTTIVFSTHLMDHVERLCSHAAILHEGRLAASGSLDELRDRFARGRSLEDAFVEAVGGVKPTA
jgi:ABC-type multidrug transport system ATPase subunit